MRWLWIVFVLFVAAFVQATLVPGIEVRGARPDLPLLAAAWLVLREPADRSARWRGFWIGWLGGFLVDLYSAGSHLPLGSTALVFGLGGLALSRVGGQLFLGSVLAQVLVLGPFCFLVHAVLGLFLVVAADGPVRPLIVQAVGWAVYSALVAPLLFAAVRWFRGPVRVRARKGLERA